MQQAIWAENWLLYFQGIDDKLLYLVKYDFTHLPTLHLFIITTDRKKKGINAPGSHLKIMPCSEKATRCPQSCFCGDMELSSQDRDHLWKQR